MESLFLFYKRGYIVPATDSFVCCGRIRDLEVFREFLKFIKVFGLKKHFSKILYLGGSDPFVSALSLKYQKWCLPDQYPNSPTKN